MNRGGEPLEVTIIGEKATVVPAGPRIVKDKDSYGRRTVERVVGFVHQPYIIISTDPGGTRSIDPRSIYLK